MQIPFSQVMPSNVGTLYIEVHMQRQCSLAALALAASVFGAGSPQSSRMVSIRLAEAFQRLS